MNEKSFFNFILIMSVLTAFLLSGFFACTNPQIEVGKENIPSTNANLSSLELTYKEYSVDNSGDATVKQKRLALSPIFNKDTVAYNSDLSFDTDVLYIKPVVEDGKSSIKINNQFAKNEKENPLIIKKNSITITTVKILVTSQLGIEKEYKVLLNIKDDSATTTTTVSDLSGDTTTTLDSDSTTTTLSDLTSDTTTTIAGNTTTTLEDISGDVTTATQGKNVTTTTAGGNNASTSTLPNITTTTAGGNNPSTTTIINITTTTVGGNNPTTTNGTIPSTSTTSGNNPSTTTPPTTVVTTIPVTTTSSSTTVTTIPTTTTTTTTIPFDGVIIYYKSTASNPPTIWAWELDGKAVMTQINASYAWPGPSMTAVSGKTNWYKLDIPSSAMSNPIKELHMKFNGGSTEYIRSVPVKTGWLSGSTWTDDCPDLPQKPSIVISPSGGTVKGVDKITITITSEIEVTNRSVTFGSSSINMNSDSLEINVSTYLSDMQNSTLSVAATNATGTNTVTGNFTRNDNYVQPENPFSWDNALVYFVMTDRFYNGNIANDTPYGRVKTDSKGKNIGTFHGGDLAGLKAKVDDNYFSDLGVNAIWITAPYEQIHGWVGGGSSGDFAHYGYHGYYALDFTALDKNMGTVQELRDFVDAAHNKNIRVVFDIVMNHAGYENLKDMETYSFGSLQSGSYNWQPSSSETFHQWNDLKGTTGWDNWWTSTWIRASFYGNAGSDDLTKCLDFLPDFKTEATGGVGVPKLLETKWAQETSGYSDWINPSAASLRTNLNVAPAEYLTKWLAAWVKEFGIDGFRVDTAKHVDMYRWSALKTACSTAYDEWRAANPVKAEKIPLPVGKTKGSFWMTGEVWGHGANKSNYHTDGNFDSVINFSFPKDGNIGSIGSTWSGYASSINGDSDFNVLSYISSHDQGLTRGNLKNLGTALVLTPGGSQIYYGDESGRPFGDTGSDTYQGTRSDMNWSSMDNDALSHWQKLGRFRNRHIAVGGGSQSDLGNNTYGRVYDKNGITDKVVIAISQSGSVQVNVSGIFADGTSVKNYYDGSTGTVSGGKVTFSAGTNGVILIEEN